MQESMSGHRKEIFIIIIIHFSYNTVHTHAFFYLSYNAVKIHFLYMMLIHKTVFQNFPQFFIQG
jgi:hypothetical protein